jgi:hypothetical protein
MHVKGRFRYISFGIILIFSFSLYPSDPSVDDSVEIEQLKVTAQSSAKKFPIVSQAATQQFLQPGEKQPREDRFYHNGKGDAGYRAHVGTANVSVGTDVGSLMRFAKDFVSILFGGQEEKEHPATVAHNAKQDKMFAQLKEDRKDFESRYATQTEEQLAARQAQIAQERRRVIDRGIEQGYTAQNKGYTRKVRREAQKEHERLSYENRKLGTESNVIEERVKAIEQSTPAIVKVNANNIASVPIAKTISANGQNTTTVPVTVTEIKEQKPQTAALKSVIFAQPSEFKGSDALKSAPKIPADPKLAHIMSLANKSKKSTGVSKRPSVPMPSTLPKKPTKVASNLKNRIGKCDKALREAQNDAEAVLYIVGFVTRSMFDFITSDPEHPRLDRFYRCTIDTFPHEVNLSLEDIVKENYHTHLKGFSTGRLICLYDYADDFIDPKNRPLFFGYSEARLEQNKKMEVFGEHVKTELKKRSGYSSDNTAQDKFSWHKDIVEQMARDSNNFIEESRGYRYFAKKLETGEEVWLVEKDGSIKGSNIVIPEEIKITKFSPEEQVVYMDDEEVLNTNYTSLLANMSDKGLTLLQDKSKKYLEKTDREWDSNFIDRNWRYYVGMPSSYTLREELQKRVNDEISSRNALALQEQEEFEFYDDQVQTPPLVEQIPLNVPTESLLPSMPVEKELSKSEPVTETPVVSMVPSSEVLMDDLFSNNMVQPDVRLKIINNYVNRDAFNTISHWLKKAQHKTYTHDASVLSDCTTKQYTVASDTVDFARGYDIAEKNLIALHGTSYEQQLHAEFLGQLNQAKTISAYYALKPDNILIDTLCQSVAIGMEANRLHQPDKAVLWARFGKEALKIIEGMGAGLELFADNTIHMIRHPIHTLVQTIDGLGKLTGLVARTTAHGMGTFARWHELMERGDGLMMAQEMDQVAYKVKALGNYYVDKIISLEPRDIAKHGTAFAADVLLTHRIFAFGGNLCVRATPVIRNAMAHINSRVSKINNAMIEAVNTVKTESPVLQTTEGFLMKASEDLNKIGGGTAGVISSTRLALEAAHAEYMAGFKAELEMLKLACDNKVKDVARFGNKYLKPQYAHILGMDLYFARRGLPKIGGFHLDLMNTIEKTNIFTYVGKIVYENGFYKAKLFYGENLVKEITFFPSHWSRKQVIEKIYEAYDNFRKSGVEPLIRDGKYYIEGAIQEGVDIAMYITKNGEIKTAYPVLPKGTR